jgi:hypothetical protein
MAPTRIRVLRARADAISFSGKHRSESELWFADTGGDQPSCQVRVRRDRFCGDIRFGRATDDATRTKGFLSESLHATSTSRQPPPAVKPDDDIVMEPRSAPEETNVEQGLGERVGFGREDYEDEGQAYTHLAHKA